jgi:hypothetical protein
MDMKWRIPAEGADEIFPIATYSRPLPSYEQLIQFMSKSRANYVAKINKENECKSSLFAGFMSKTFLNLIKHFCQDSYQENIELIRFSILESNCYTFEWYINMKSLMFKSLEFDGKQKQAFSQDGSESTPVKNIEDTEYVNVDVLHQDRKKKHRTVV